MADEKKKEEKKPEAEAEKPAEKAEDGEEKKEVEVPEKFKSLVEEIEKMSVLDLSELVSILEDKFGVSAAAPMMVAGAMPGAEGAAAGGEEEKSSYDVELAGVGENKIAVIKAVREVTQLGLAEAKGLVDGAPSVVAEAVKKEDAEEMKAKLEEAGAEVNLK